MTEHTNPVERSFIERTLEILESHPDPERDVTQQLNLLAGILIYPWETVRCKDLNKTGITLKDKVEERYEPTSNAKKLIKHLRNAFAHFNVEFKNEAKKIKGLYVWDKDPKTEELKWFAYISADSLPDLIDDIAKIFNEVLPEGSIVPSRVDELEKKYNVSLRHPKR